MLRHASLSLWRLCSQGKNLILSLASIMLTAALHPLRSSLLPALFSLRFNFPSQSSNSNQSKLLQMQCFAFRLNAFPVTSGSVPRSLFYLWPLSVSAAHLFSPCRLCRSTPTCHEDNGGEKRKKKREHFRDWANRRTRRLNECLHKQMAAQQVNEWTCRQGRRRDCCTRISSV